MEDNFTNQDFEEFLQDQVRNHRMYPSDAVWRDISKKLHGDRRWPALTIAALLLFSATLFTCLYFTPKPNIFSIKPSILPAKSEHVLHGDNVLNNLTSQAPFTKYKGNNTASFDQVQPQRAEAQYPDTATIASLDKLPSLPGSVSIALATTAGNVKNQFTNKIQFADARPESEAVAELNSSETGNNANANQNVKQENLRNISKSDIVPQSEKISKDYNDKNMADEFLKDHNADLPLYTTIKKKTARHKFGYEVYAAPSISYRKLLEDKSMFNGNASGPVGLNYVADVNKVVRHKPGTGLEAGVSFLYNLTDKFRVKAGFQFNIRQYSIEAYRSNIELASIALVGNNRIDTVNSLAIYRTNNGYYSDELVNRYYQLSVPLGIEWEVIGNKKVQFNLAASIQPTYLLNHNAYLISTNFKNYTESPDMVRTWNINSNVEAFLSFVIGDYKWQLGPQIRYQPYSTFIPQYPIKEHLMDYGIKIGVSKTIN